MPHADIYNIRYPLQHGIRKSRSCETQLIEFIEVSKNLKDGKQTDIFSYALHKVSHSLFLRKLNYYRIEGMGWIK